MKVDLMRIALPLKSLAVIAAAALALGWVIYQPPAALPGPEVAVIPAGAYTYRPAGEFRTGNRIVDAPAEQRKAAKALRIMKFHVSQAEYGRCVADAACLPSTSQSASEFAQVNISYLDATAYARWLSKQTQQTWRLPTDAEWVRAAGDRYVQVSLGPLSNDPDPSKRWIARYREEAALRGQSDPELRQIGHYGANTYGVVDIGGNIWEWTDTCFQNGTVSGDGSELTSTTDYCGVRAAQGKHRAFIIDFVRDARGGGCAAGVPPDNLGIRLVLEDG
ncbi:MAG: SUMF1/EgtB/PvdO family nonheme iron enzyme [Sulfitobacter sp.]